MTNTAFSLIPLTDLAVISLTGADATTFLQSQLTQDVSALDSDHATLAGYCTARGRLLASLIAVRQGTEPSDGWLLMTKADNALAFAQRLRMFVLRAKVDVTISDSAVVGVRIHGSGSAGATGNTDVAAGHSSAHQGLGLTLPDPASPYTVVRHNDEIRICAPGPVGAADTRWWLLNAPDLDLEAPDTALLAWQADDIAAGLPWVQAATQETFIPQTLNMDLINGVSFTKGCYPGQEVVARSHYRGTIKRRMAYATGTVVGIDSDHDMVGADTFDANNPGRPCGRVINAARVADQIHVLMEVQLSDLDSADFRLGADDGPAVSITTLPYTIQPDVDA